MARDFKLWGKLVFLFHGNSYHRQKNNMWLSLAKVLPIFHAMLMLYIHTCMHTYSNLHIAFSLQIPAKTCWSQATTLFDQFTNGHSQVTHTSHEWTQTGNTDGHSQVTRSDEGTQTDTHKSLGVTREHRWTLTSHSHESRGNRDLIVVCRLCVVIVSGAMGRIMSFEIWLRALRWAARCDAIS